MPKFFTDIKNIKGDEITITGQDSFHIYKVLRMKRNDEIIICDMAGFDYICKIKELNESECISSIIDKKQSESESEKGVRISLFQGMPKSDKMENIIKKSTELGVFEIFPVMTMRCISRPDEKSLKKKIERYNKIAFESAKQSGRGIIPKVHNLIDLNQIGTMIENFDKIIVFYEKKGEFLRNIITENDKKIGIIIGSEGGFEESEIEFIKNIGGNIATLGKRILRCETAPISSLSLIWQLKGEM